MPDDARTAAPPAAHALAGLLAALLLAAALVLGGGGSPAPLPELLLEWLALAVLAAWLILPASREMWRKVPHSAWLVCGLAVAVPLLQLVPLPPALWQAMPGRAIEVEALALIGQQDTWRPLSMDPARTLAALLSLIVPLVMLVIAATLDRRGRFRLVLVVAAAALATLVVGTLQLGSGEDSPIQFYGIAAPTLRGFQANYNATADLLLAAMCLVPFLLRTGVERGLVPDRRAIVLGLAALGLAVPGFGVVLTTSRMGMALMLLPLFLSAWMLRGWLPRAGWRAALGALALIGLAGLGILALAQGNTALGRIAQKFDFSRELRAELWRDGLYVARQNYPVGVGMGNFVPALVAAERLEVVRPSMPNRAHNEYVELSVEAGLPGLLAWGAVILLVGAAAWRGRRHAEVPTATAILAVLALHSMVDYPFRSMSLATLGAVCAAAVLAAGSNRKEEA